MMGYPRLETGLSLDIALGGRPSKDFMTSLTGAVK